MSSASVGIPIDKTVRNLDPAIPEALQSDSAPFTTIEYDVVKCADFKEDKGRWVRYMPEEIKRANPDFVPT
eukprot:CAMPEP_0118635842 /NCGR_PEP_ID=MMETSP0785-20121206/2291_1 /TAXON_ID=91992 /ORGANISM="Bolidomonas pacifica, Strain CCMP 1866" /LENGTH=70 /DNA_ID=CAMNT_0006526901 /DNA_START=389 /DNA_END=601 /DNA_ORIENTATION=+